MSNPPDFDAGSPTISPGNGPQRNDRVRSWLFAPGHNEKLLAKVFECGADAVLLDLEDAVPPDLKDKARELVKEVASARDCWVRVNRPRSKECLLDLGALSGTAIGIRLPKVESSADIEWVAAHAPGVPVDCTIESARGVLNAYKIASSPHCRLLSYGGIDLAVDLGTANGEMETLFVRSSIVVAARAAEKAPPSDGVYVHIDDDEGLEREARHAQHLGFFGKSAVHPRQVPIINSVFTTARSELAWANRVLAAFEASTGAATKLPDGEFVDLAVAQQARRILGLT